MNNPVIQTTVSQTEENIDDILFGGAPGGPNVVTPAEGTESKPGIFSNEQTDLSFLDPASTKPAEEVPHGTSTTKETEESTETIDTVLNEAELEAEQAAAGKAGRPKTDKSGLVDFLKKRIEAGSMFTFDDYDESKQTLDEYLGSLSQKDLDELWEANQNEKENRVKTDVQKQFFEALPQELQFAAKYVADGGTDIKGLFQALAQVEETRALDPTNEDDQKQIVREYLRATQFGTEAEIEEEVTTWEDLGQLAKKSQQFKPKLDKMQEQQVAARLAQQEQLRQQQEQAAQRYVNNVYEALKPAEINGIKLDNKQQAFLYNNLVNANYPSISGQPTNLLGHLLEKYQTTEPNFSLVAEALWLLSDPEGYRSQVSRKDVNKELGATVKQLRTEQSRKISGASSQEATEETTNRPRKISRPSAANIFKR